MSEPQVKRDAKYYRELRNDVLGRGSRTSLTGTPAKALDDAVAKLENDRPAENPGRRISQPAHLLNPPHPYEPGTDETGELLNQLAELRQAVRAHPDQTPDTAQAVTEIDSLIATLWTAATLDGEVDYEDVENTLNRIRRLTQASALLSRMADAIVVPPQAHHA